MMIASDFRLPFRRLPDACRSGAALVIADGPSLAEYSLHEINACGATLCCYGRSASVVKCQHYWICDFAHVGIIASLAPIPNVYACDVIFESGVVEQVPQHGWIKADPRCSFHPVVEIDQGFSNLYGGFEFIFVLGVDGYRRGDGSLRRLRYPKFLPQLVHVDPDYFASDEAWQQMNNSTNLYLTRRNPRIRNLSPTSAYSAVWGIEQDVLNQPFGRINRESEAIIVDCTGSFLPGSSVGRYPSQSYLAILGYLTKMREHHPSLPIFLRCSEQWMSTLDADLSGASIVIGGPQAQIGGDCMFSEVATIYLPEPGE